MKEWTKCSLGKDRTGVEMWEIMSGNKQVATCCGENADAFLAAHKAALAAERSEREIIERSRDAWKSQVAGLAKQLADEREEHKKDIGALIDGNTAKTLALRAELAAALAKAKEEK
jgi:hypothetical protein